MIILKEQYENKEGTPSRKKAKMKQHFFALNHTKLNQHPDHSQ